MKAQVGSDDGGEFVQVLKRGYAFLPDPNRTASGRGVVVAVLKCKTGYFGWRLTSRQAAALLLAGFTCRPAA